MKLIPDTENALFLRMDFSNEVAWKAISAAIRKPVGILRFRANVDFLNDVEFADITKAQMLKLIPKDYSHSFIVLVDRTATLLLDHPLLIVDLSERSGREFRALPSQVQAIENNLSISNMDFEEFAEAIDESGVFRGFT
jgi:hypothetical protein